MRRILSALAFAVAAAISLHAQSADCNAPLPSQQVSVSLPGRPFKLAVTPDGCRIFASLLGANQGQAGGGLAVLQRRGGHIEVVRNVSENTGRGGGAGLGGLALTHDGKILIATTGHGVVLMDVARLVNGGKEDPVISTVEEGPDAASIFVNVSADDRLVFVSDEGAGTITVIDLAKARSPKTAAQAILGKIPTGRAPIALTFSPDGRWLYTTSEHAAPGWGWPAICEPEVARPGATVKVPQGVVSVVDVQRAGSDPAHAVVARVPAGCVAVRLALSPKGDRAYVTARKSNAVLVLDTAALTADPEHALLGTIPVGTAPVPLVVLDAGKRVIAGNSNRFGNDAGAGSTLTVLDTAKIGKGADAVIGSIVCGGFPRDLILSPDGNTVFVANYLTSTLQALDSRHLPLR